MYNEAKKNKFLETVDSTHTIQFYKNVLNNCEKIEVEKQKDLYDFDDNDLNQLLLHLRAIDENGNVKNHAIISVLRKYIDYVISNTPASFLGMYIKENEE